MAYFGDPWDAPVVDDGHQAPTPVGERCNDCGEKVVDGDQGLLVPTVRAGEDGEGAVMSLEPLHRECLLRSVLRVRL